MPYIIYMARILIADDDDILVDLVSFRLEAAGHDVVVAADGGEALRIAYTERPDAIILDAMMPIKSGMEVLRELRGLTRFKDMPIMMLTSRKGEDDVVSSLRAGAQDYMTKPFIPQELAVRIELLLKSVNKLSNET